MDTGLTLNQPHENPQPDRIAKRLKHVRNPPDIRIAVWFGIHNVIISLFCEIPNQKKSTIMDELFDLLQKNTFAMAN